MLPTEPTKPKTDLRDFVTFIYGAPKIGKSTFCSKADHALFIATEPGLNCVEVYQTECANWQQFKQICSEIRKGDHQFRTIVIDTIDNLYMMCVKSVLDKHKIDHQSDLQYGKGYDLVNTEFRSVMVSLSLLPYGLMMTSHAVEKEVKVRTGKEMRITSTLPASARKIVLGMADFILYADMDELKDDHGAITELRRVLHSQPTTIYEAGNRSQFIIPDPLPLDYNAFAEAMRNGQSNTETTPTLITTVGGKSNGSSSSRA